MNVNRSSLSSMDLQHIPGLERILTNIKICEFEMRGLNETQVNNTARLAKGFISINYFRRIKIQSGFTMRAAFFWKGIWTTIRFSDSKDHKYCRNQCEITVSGSIIFFCTRRDRGWCCLSMSVFSVELLPKYHPESSSSRARQVDAELFMSSAQSENKTSGFFGPDERRALYDQMEPLAMPKGEDLLRWNSMN
nr:AlNc14C19G1940 [Albugo laibachii Nc14]|eukprot:CCA16159.1 AlNc14C19G1940 [Albugo laibachii Nc14]